MIMIGKVYPTHDADVHEQVYEQLRESLCQSKPNISNSETLCGREYRVGTWVCIMVAAANTLAGVNLINQYANTIYSQIEAEIVKNGKTPTLSGSTCVQIVGIVGFLASTTALCTVRGLTRRAFFIGGHTVISIALVLCIVFYENFQIVPFLIFHGLMIVGF